MLSSLADLDPWNLEHSGHFWGARSAVLSWAWCADADNLRLVTGSVTPSTGTVCKETEIRENLVAVGVCTVSVGSPSERGPQLLVH